MGEHVEHPSRNSNNLRNDLAIITLPEPITWTDTISPICLPASDGNQYVGTLATLSGWGRPSDSSSSISPVLRKTNTTIITTNHLCIGTTDGHGSCNGDSGGPLSDVSEDG